MRGAAAFVLSKPEEEEKVHARRMMRVIGIKRSDQNLPSPALHE
jgi:hypothetical protein